MEQKNIDTDKLFYYLCEAIQVRYSDKELQKYLDPNVINEKRQLKETLLRFVHKLEMAYIGYIYSRKTI